MSQITGLRLALRLQYRHAMFLTIDSEQLGTTHGGRVKGPAYRVGYAGGWSVTRLLELTPWGSKIVLDPANPSRRIPRADIPVIGPKLTAKGYKHLGAGATDSVNDLADRHARYF